MTISAITITLSTILLASESPLADTDSMDHSDHAAVGDPAVEAVQAALEAAHPEAEVSVGWSRDAMMRHSIEVEVDDEPCGAGDREITDVRDAMLAALDSLHA